DDVRNLLFRSEGSTTNWVLQQITAVVDGTITDPFGTQRTLRLTEVGATTPHTFSQSIPNLYGQLSDRYTFSMYMKKGNAANAPDIMQLSYGNGFANFDINTGVVTFSGSVVSTSITDAGDGWWRCSITGGFTNTVTNNPTVFVAFVNNNPTAVVRPTYSNGAGASSRNVFVFGAQFELGLSVTTYQRNLVHPRLPSGFVSFSSTNFGSYWVNSSGNLQNTPYENLVWPSVRISSIANNNTWRWIDFGFGRANISNTQDPNGTLQATRLNQGAPSTRNDYFVSYQRSGNNTFNPSFPTSRIRTLILFVKQDSTDRYLGIKLGNGGNVGEYNNNAVTIKIDCSNGTLANNPTSYSITYSSQFVGDGWYKVCINRSDAWDSMLFQTSTTLAIMSNSSGVLIWGVQVLDGVYNINTPTYQRELGYSVPRLDYSGSSCPDYLLEQSNVNTLLRSEEFNLSPWVTSSLTVTPNTEPAPNEESLADTLTATANGASIRQGGTVNATISSRIFSVYLKRKTGTGDVYVNMGATGVTASLSTGSWTRAFVRDVPLSATYTTTTGAHTVTTSTNHGFSTGDTIFFDRLTGTAADVSTAITVTGPTTFTFSNGALTTSGTCTIYSNTGRIVISTNGDEVYAWGAQIDLNISSLASGQIPFSYIPTTTAQVTRASEFIVTNLSGSASCSVFYELSKIGGTNSTTLSNIYLGNETSHGIATDGLSLSGNSSGLWIYSKKENNGSVTAIAVPLLYGPGENRKTKILFNITGSSVNLWMDGSLVNTTTFANPSRLLYNALNTADGGQLRVSQVASFNKTLSTSEAQTLTYNPYFTNGTTELTFVLGRARAIGAESPSDSTLQALDTFIATLKTAGIWDKMDAIYNFAYNNTNVAAFSRINLKSTFYSLGTSGTMTYQTNGYLTGVGSSYLTGYTPGINNVQYQVESFSRTHILYQSASGAAIDVNTIHGGNDAFYNSNTNTHRAMSNVNLPQSVDMSGTGLKSIMRTSWPSVTLYNQSTGTTLTQNRSGNYGASQQFFPFGNGLGVGFSCFGAPLTQTDINTLRTAYNTYLSAIGLTPFA
ncbi:MAG: phage head spike fiber domain-containing protein, partial [Dolichospermum sp.]